MTRWRVARWGLFFMILLLTGGCAGIIIRYGETPAVVETKYTEIQNFSSDSTNAGDIDLLFEDVLRCLSVTYRQDLPKLIIAVMPPRRIQDIYDIFRQGQKKRVVALYVSLWHTAIIPYFDRRNLSHEMAHYVTHFYLNAPESEEAWEEIAEKTRLCIF